MQPVDVVVVTYNSADVVGDLLDNLPAACGDVAHRVAVVDNASTDDTVAIVRRRPEVLVVEQANLGFGAGLNTGVEALAGTGPVLLLNPDVRLEAGAVAELVRVLTDRSAGLVVPLLREPDGSTARSLRREPTVLRSVGLGDSAYPLLSEVVTEPEAYAVEHPVDWATGAVLMVDRACYDRLGGFDETFFMYSEETDFCLRARDGGTPTYLAPAAVAVHLGGGSGRNPDLYAMQVLNRIRLLRRRRGLVAAVLVLVLTSAREIVHAARGSRDSRRALSALLLRRHPALLPWRGSPLRDSVAARVAR